MKILIILLYYDRPNLVHNALHSIRMLESNEDNDYEIAAIDDGSVVSLEPIVKMHYSDIYDKFNFYRLDDTIQDKITNGGSMVGKMINKAMLDSDSDGACLLCDDDALCPNLVMDSCNWLRCNPDKSFGYWHVIDFDPTNQRPCSDLPKRGNNNHIHPLNGACNIDASQGFWRCSEVKKHNIQWAYPKTACLDASWYASIAEFGLMYFMGFFGQYKARFAGQLGNRTTDDTFYNRNNTEC